MIEYVSNKGMTCFGGIHLVHEKIISQDIIELIKKHLGERASNAEYGYSDLFLSMCYTTFCGGDCAEDINYLSETFGVLKDFKVPSADTILAMQKELSTEVQTLYSDNGNANEINYNDKLNALMVDMSIHLGVLSQGEREYTLDFDHQFLPTEKYDAEYGYKKERGYFPGVASINNTPVYIENRNGNSHVNFNQLATFKRMDKVLEDNQIIPKRYRMDSGSYLKDITDYIHSEKKGLFYIRAEQCDSMLFEAANCEKDWNKCQIGFNRYEINSFPYKFGKHTFRIVAYRWANKTGQRHLITGDANNYLFIITNDSQWDEEKIIRFYNQRGNSERLFDIQNNDFNWKKLPFSEMQYNSVYLHMMAACHILYQSLIRYFSRLFQFLQSHHRLKKFIFRLICIPAKTIRSGRRQITKLFVGHRVKQFVDYNTS